MNVGFLPLSRQELQASGITIPDFVLVTGDAYVDHPSFGAAIIGRLLERHGYSVAILSQPDWRAMDAFNEFGKPRLAWLVTSGNIDSMVNHYTVAKKRRKTDDYTPGGVTGKRPDRAVVTYCRAIRKIDPDGAIVIGGIEASLRRAAHYDYWLDQVLPSILLDAKADLLVYGMAEKAIVEVAEALASGLDVRDLIFLRQTVFTTRDRDRIPQGSLLLPPFARIQTDKTAFAKAFMSIYRNQDYRSAKVLVETYADSFVVHHPPHEPLTREEMDAIYELPFERRVHPLQAAQGQVKAIEEVRFSLAANRGCFGGCAFCALTMHQGRTITSRSKTSLVAEALHITKDPEFKGYIHDVGGPTANFHVRACRKQDRYGVCPDRQCIGDEPCPSLIVDHKEYLDVLETLRALPGVKKVFVRSGIRYDYLLYDKDPAFFEALVAHHVSGQLKVAPEHVSPAVLQAMGKPKAEVFTAFVAKYNALNQSLGKNQYLVPYFLSSHPGSKLEDAIQLAEFIRDMGYNPEQVQDFYPTPMTLATTMYHTGLDPRTLKPIYVPQSAHEKAMQRALIQYRNPKNHGLVKEALERAGRTDLIGTGPKCLIKPLSSVKITKKRRSTTILPKT